MDWEKSVPQKRTTPLIYKVGQRLIAKQRISARPVGPESAKNTSYPGSTGTSTNEPTHRSAVRFPSMSCCCDELGVSESLYWRSLGVYVQQLHRSTE